MVQEKSSLFEELYRAYLVPLKKTAANIGVAYDDIEDLVQETMLCYYDKYPLDWNNKQKRAMLGKILRNKWIDQYRKNSHYTAVSIDNWDDAVIVTKKLIVRDTLSYVIDNEVYKELRTMIDKLKDEWRVIILLHVVDGVPIKKISSSLGIREAACRTRISRAKKYLREQIKKEGLDTN